MIVQPVVGFESLTPYILRMDPCNNKNFFKKRKQKKCCSVDDAYRPDEGKEDKTMREKELGMTCHTGKKTGGSIAIIW